jgi:hypothetical protein
VRTLAALVLVFGLALASGPWCSPPAAPRTEGPVGVLRFPGPWVRTDAAGRLRVLNDVPQYVFRESASGALLVAVKPRSAEDLTGRDVTDPSPAQQPSDNRYAVSTDGRFNVAPARAGEWEAGRELEHGYHFIPSHDGAAGPEGVRYGGRVFAKSGETWCNEAALVSPRGSWVAVFSYTSREPPARPLVPGFGSSEPARGEIFLDLYDATAGRRVIAARAPFGAGGAGFAPSMLSADSVWLGERYFVMPLDWNLEVCYLGILPEK